MDLCCTIWISECLIWVDDLRPSRHSSMGAMILERSSIFPSRRKPVSEAVASGNKIARGRLPYLAVKL
jgi:hypothetical protein